MKVVITWIILLSAAFLPDGVGRGDFNRPTTEVVTTNRGSLTTEVVTTNGANLTGVWAFAADGYYMAVTDDGRLCSGGSAESVAAGRWCNAFSLEGDVLTETCMGGPEDRNCPLGGGRCVARVAVDEAGRLSYHIVQEACDMLPFKMLPPAETGPATFPALRHAYTLERVSWAAGAAGAPEEGCMTWGCR